MSIKKHIVHLGRTKDALRDELWSLKSLVRRSFGTMSTELVEMQDQLVSGILQFQEEAILSRVLGADVNTGANASINAVFQSIDRMHKALEKAGVRRKRTHIMSPPTPSAALDGTGTCTSPIGELLLSGDDEDGGAANDLPVSPTLRPQTSIGAALELCQTVTISGQQQGVDSADVDGWSGGYDAGHAPDIELGAARRRKPIQFDNTTDADVSPAPTTMTTASFSRYRNASFEPGSVFSVSPYALAQSCQLRLETLSCLRAEVLSGALQAQRRLMIAKRWVPDAPQPLVASIEGLLAEVQAMRRQLLEEAPSMAMAAFPNVQYPLPSINIKQMKQQLAQQRRSSPRRSPSPRASQHNTLGALSLSPNACIVAQKYGSTLLDGTAAADVRSNQNVRDNAMFLRRKKVLSGGASIEQSLAKPATTEAVFRDVDIIRQRERTSSDDIQKILRTVKSEVQRLPGGIANRQAPHRPPYKINLTNRSAEEVLESLTSSLHDTLPVKGPAPSVLARAVSPPVSRASTSMV